jgi:hypothetical protein
MNSTHSRLAVLLALSTLALVACGGSSTDSLVGPEGAGDTALFLASDKGGPAPDSGDGVCDGCDGTCDGDGPNGPNGPGHGNGPGDGTCDGDGTGPNGPNGPGDGVCDGSAPGDGTCEVTSPDGLQAVLVEALQEEYLAEWTYRRVLADFGNVAPFSAIAESEQTHVQAILRLFARREWTAPDSAWTLDNVGTFDTLPAACAGAVAIEIEDGALYERFLAWDELPPDARNVFTNLRAVSLERHLPAFQRCQ